MFFSYKQLVFQYRLFKRLLFPLNYLAFVIKSLLAIHVGLFLESVPLISSFILTSVLSWLEYCIFRKVLKLGSADSSMFLFFKIILAILGSLCYHINFIISLSVSTERTLQFFFHALTLQIILRRIDILTFFCLLIHVSAKLWVKSASLTCFWK